MQITKRIPRGLHWLNVRQVQTAGEGDHSDGGGLLLRVRGESSSWVFRFTSKSGKRREMGFGRAYRNNAQAAGESLVAARKRAQDARDKSAAQRELHELYASNAGIGDLVNAQIRTTEGFKYTSFNPSLGLNWLQVRDLNLYGNVGRGARVPSVVELGAHSTARR